MAGGDDDSLGVIVTGIARNYLYECFPDGGFPHPVLEIRQYPVPREKVNELIDRCERVLVIEEGYPFVEDMLQGLLPPGKPIQGRLDGTLPRTGELSPDDVRRALGLSAEGVGEIPDIVQQRPPQLCKGCPHVDSYLFLTEVLKEYESSRVFSDIGCYTLGALPPFNAIHSCVDMGASITMAKGAADAGIRPAVAVIGDSTFTHSGMTGLLDAVYENAAITVLILDNATTGMTGGQDSLATGRLPGLVAGLGVEPEHLHVIRPNKANHEENMRILRAEAEYEGVSVIIAERPCIQIKRRV
jgi:indolepyruvate ferredoxin oxidoreductase alpha subunit